MDSKLSLHLKNIKGIVFGSKKKLSKLQQHFSVHCNDHSIFKSQTSVKYLDVVIDNIFSGTTAVIGGYIEI